MCWGLQQEQISMMQATVHVLEVQEEMTIPTRPISAFALEMAVIQMVNLPVLVVNEKQ